MLFLFLVILWVHVSSEFDMYLLIYWIFKKNHQNHLNNKILYYILDSVHFIHGDNALKKMQFKSSIFAFLITSRGALTSTNIVITILKNSRFFYSINQTRFVFILHCFSNIVGITISDILRLCEKTTWKDHLKRPFIK